MYFDFPIAMTSVVHPYVELAAQILLTIAFLLALVRLIKGPDITDRVVALDLIAGIVLAYTLFHSIVEEDLNFMSVSMAIAVISFLGTVAIARYLELRTATEHSKIK